MKKSIYDLEKQQQQKKKERKNISALRHSCLCWWKNIKVFPRWLCPEKKNEREAKIFLFLCKKKKTDFEQKHKLGCCWIKLKFYVKSFTSSAKGKSTKIRGNIFCVSKWKCSASERKWIYWGFKGHKINESWWRFTSLKYCCIAAQIHSSVTQIQKQQQKKKKKIHFLCKFWANIFSISIHSAKSFSLPVTT